MTAIMVTNRESGDASRRRAAVPHMQCLLELLGQRGVGIEDVMRPRTMRDYETRHSVIRVLQVTRNMSDWDIFNMIGGEMREIRAVMRGLADRV